MTNASHLPDQPEPPPRYLAYLLRLRRDTPSTPWRVTLENPHTGERLGFATLPQFIAYLYEKIEEEG